MRKTDEGGYALWRKDNLSLMSSVQELTRQDSPGRNVRVTLWHETNKLTPHKEIFQFQTF